MQNDERTTQVQFGKRNIGQALARGCAKSDWRYALTASESWHDETSAALECLTFNSQPSGQHVQAFEQEFAKMQGARHAVAVDNGTAGLHLTLLAAKVGQSTDDEVIQPSLSAAAAANMTVAAGARPVFADIVSPLEPTLDPNEVSGLISPNTRAVVATHYGGYPARIAALEELCQARGPLLIEQSAYGSGYADPEFANHTLGPAGHVRCFSLHSNTPSPWGEGGIVVTNDDELAARMRSVSWRSPNSLSVECDTGRIGAEAIMAHGFNYRMNDVRAAIGRAQLQTMPAASALRQRRAQAYANVVETFCDGTIEYVFGWAPRVGAAHVAAILVEPRMRDDLRAFLTEKRVQTNLHWPPLHTLNAFASCLAGGLPRTITFADRVIMLPIHADLPVMAPEHIIRLCMMYLDRSKNALPSPAQGNLKVA